MIAKRIHKKTYWKIYWTTNEEIGRATYWGEEAYWEIDKATEGETYEATSAATSEAASGATREAAKLALEVWDEC